MDHRDEPGWIRIEGKENGICVGSEDYDWTAIKLPVRAGALEMGCFETSRIVSLDSSLTYSYWRYLLFCSLDIWGTCVKKKKKKPKL